MCALVGVYSHCDQNSVKMSSSKTAVGTGDASFSDAPSASDTNPNGPWKRMPHSARACVPEGAHLGGRIAGSVLFVRRGGKTDFQSTIDEATSPESKIVTYIRTSTPEIYLGLFFGFVWSVGNGFRPLSIKKKTGLFFFLIHSCENCR